MKVFKHYLSLESGQKVSLPKCAKILSAQVQSNNGLSLWALPYLAADVFTIGLAEIILWPLELSLLDSAKCTGIASYDSKLNAKTWNLSSKGSSAQDC
jgi:hypothetical protein